MNVSASIIEKESQYIVHTYKRSPFILERGEGMYVYDSEGNRYLDFSSGIAVNALGHCDPELVAAVQEQVATLGHVCNLYHTRPQVELAEALCGHSFADKVFYCNSGAEAVEGAIKFARKYSLTHYGPGKTFVAFTGGFHGRTMGALAITAREQYQAPFRPLMPGVTVAPFNDIEAAEEMIGPGTCSVFVEPVQGEGGIRSADAEFLRALRDLCDQHDALLVFDEIQCGMGRTGKLWAYEHYGVEPDIMVLAKALGGGLPVGAVLVTDRVAEVIEPGDHGSTFAAGPVACRAAQVVLDRVSDPAMLAHITAMGKLLVERLEELDSPHIKEVRGLGLMIGIEMDCEVAPLIQAAYAQGVILLNAGANVLRLLPAYIVSEADIDRCVSVIRQIITA